MYKTIIILALTLLEIKAQPAYEYYALLNKAETFFVKGELQEALNLYDSALEKYNYPFYSHIKQAAIISHYLEDDFFTQKFIEKCVQSGMNRVELDWFLSRNKGKSFIDTIISNYNSLRQIYADGIDSVAMINFLEIDAIDIYVNGISYLKNGQSEKTKEKQDSLYIELMKRYILLINKHGFPTEKRVGLDRVIHNENEYPMQSSWENTFSFQITYNHDLLIDSNKNKFWTNENFGMNKREGSRPGNHFLFHFGIRTLPYNNDSLLQILINGMLELKVNPLVIMHHLEYNAWLRNNGKRDKVFDCGCSYWSKAFVTEARTTYKMQDLPKLKRIEINECREKFFMRSIEREKELFNRLFFLEHQKYPKRYSRKNVKQIKFTYNTFI